MFQTPAARGIPHWSRTVLLAATATGWHRLTFAASRSMVIQPDLTDGPRLSLGDLASMTLPRLTVWMGWLRSWCREDRSRSSSSPDHHELLSASVTVHDLLDAVRRSNLIRFAGVATPDHELYLTLVSGQVRTPQQICRNRRQADPAGGPVRNLGDVAPHK